MLVSGAQAAAAIDVGQRGFVLSSRKSTMLPTSVLRVGAAKTAMDVAASRIVIASQECARSPTGHADLVRPKIAGTRPVARPTRGAQGAQPRHLPTRTASFPRSHRNHGADRQGTVRVRVPRNRKLTSGGTIALRSRHHAGGVRVRPGRSFSCLATRRRSDHRSRRARSMNMNDAEGRCTHPVARAPDHSTARLITM